MPVNVVGWCVQLQGAVDSEMLRHLATQVGDEWRCLAKCLGIRSVRQLQACTSGNSDGVAATARRDAVYDLLTSWMKKMPRAANKVRLSNTGVCVKVYSYLCCRLQSLYQLEHESR